MTNYTIRQCVDGQRLLTVLDVETGGKSRRYVGVKDVRTTETSVKPDPAFESPEWLLLRGVAPSTVCLLYPTLKPENFRELPLTKSDPEFSLFRKRETVYILSQPEDRGV